jgi:peptidoglycan/LPS O-acetylase OafA/YrhL
MRKISENEVKMQNESAAAKPARHYSLQFRSDIEGIRAIAVIFVVLYHAGLRYPSGGFTGVDIFFVLSGYLITSLLAKELNTSGHIDLVRFYARRVRRLLPASTLVVAVVCLIEAVISSPLASISVLRAGLATTLYASNIFFSYQQLDYFAQGVAQNPLLHTWSLAVEEQFYMVLPVLLLVLWKIRKGPRLILIVLSAIAIVSFAGCVWFTRTNQVLAFFQSPARAWEFCAGGLVSFIPRESLRNRKTLCAILGITGLIALFASVGFITTAMSFPGALALVPVLATLATLQAGAGAPQSLAVRILNLPPFQYFGELSYSLYLWHWPALVIGKQLFPSNSLAVRAGCVAVAVLLSAVTHVVIENPIRFSTYLAPRSKTSLAIGGAFMAICLCGFAVWQSTIHRSEQFQRFYRVSKDIPSMYAMGCETALTESKPKMCTFGDASNGQKTVVLFGDSHAAQWFQAVKDIAETQHWKLITLVKSACSPMSINADSMHNPGATQSCGIWRKAAVETIRKMHPDLVIASSSSIYQEKDSTKPIDPANWERGTRETLLAIAGDGIPVKVIRDTPHAEYDISQCLAQAAWDGRTVCAPLSRDSALSPLVYQAEVSGAANLPNVKFVDMTDDICSPNICDLQRGNVILYRDSNHLTASYAESLSDALKKKLIPDQN